MPPPTPAVLARCRAATSPPALCHLLATALVLLLSACCHAPRAAAQRFSSGNTPSGGTIGVPCTYIQNLGVAYSRRGGRCYVQKSGRSYNTVSQMTDIIGGGIHQVSRAGASRSGRGYRRQSSTGNLGNPYNSGSYSGGLYGSSTRRGPYGRHLLQAADTNGDGSTKTCPIVVSDMKEEMKLLVKPCSVSVEDNAMFCQECLRAMQFMLSSKYHSDQLLGNHLYDVKPEDGEAVAKACSLDAINFMEDELGIPVSDDNFIVNVLLCKSFHKDAKCPKNVEALVNGPLNSMLNSCHDYLTEEAAEDAPVEPASPSGIAAILSYIWGLTGGRLNRRDDTTATIMSNTGEPKYMLETDDSAYCSSCYYPFYEVMTKQTISDEFWCKHADMVNKTGGAVTAEAFHAALMQDEQFMSCLFNTLYYLEYHDETLMNPFGSENLDIMVSNLCWNEENHPKTPWFSEDDWEEIMTKPCGKH